MRTQDEEEKDLLDRMHFYYMEPILGPAPDPVVIRYANFEVGAERTYAHADKLFLGLRHDFPTLFPEPVLEDLIPVSYRPRWELVKQREINRKIQDQKRSVESDTRWLQELTAQRDLLDEEITELKNKLSSLTPTGAL